MSRVLLIQFQQEVSSFNPALTSYGDFEIAHGAAMLDAYAGTNTFLAGALQALDAATGVTVVPVISATACSGGEVAPDTLSRLMDEILAAVRTAAEDPVDGVLFLLHGAMASAPELDPEGALLDSVRSIVGPDTVFAMSLDLHGILTARMIAACPLLAALRTYPHVDFVDTGRRAAELLLHGLRTHHRPVAARLRVPMLVRGDQCITDTGIYGRYVDKAAALEQRPGILSASVLIGNPFTDVPELCTQVVVVAEEDAELARRGVLELADGLFNERSQMQADLVSVEEAVSGALAADGPILFVDAADAPSSGASGDSNHLIAALREAGYDGTVLAPLVDPPTVQLAHQAGVGGRATFSLGGARDSRFTPIHWEADVAIVRDGPYPMESWGIEDDAGPTAKLQSGQTTIVAATRPVQLFDRSLFLAHGADPRDFDLVIVKSPHCQPHFFDDWAKHRFNVDAPGATSANLKSLGHTRCQRPIYPLDRDFDFIHDVEMIAANTPYNLTRP